MKVRGERECRDCGTRWSYYETGSVACPKCGSLRSRGQGERRLHTNGSVALDLDAARARAAADDLDGAADEAVEACRAYLRKRGFVDAGELLPLDDTYVAAQELLHASTVARTGLQTTDEEASYLIALLQGAEDGDRPPADRVPKPYRVARGLGAAASVRDYRDELRDWAAETDVSPPGLVERLGDHLKRVQALDGEVPPEAADRLVEAARAIGRATADADETALHEARSALDGLD